MGAVRYRSLRSSNLPEDELDGSDLTGGLRHVIETKSLPSESVPWGSPHFRTCGPWNRERAESWHFAHPIVLVGRNNLWVENLDFLRNDEASTASGKRIYRQRRKGS